jgi:hypothetical protein
MEHAMQQYEGFIVVQPGLETRVFQRNLDQREFYWVDYDLDVNTVEINNNMAKLNETTLAVWVQFEGKMEDGHFGHLNQHENRLVIKRVLNSSSKPVEQYRATHK